VVGGERAAAAEASGGAVSVSDVLARRSERLSANALELNGAETAADVSRILGSTGRAILDAVRPKSVYGEVRHDKSQRVGSGDRLGGGAPDPGNASRTATDVRSVP
jgi:uncharacterized protein with ACT and thioredoxin-like domain